MVLPGNLARRTGVARRVRKMMTTFASADDVRRAFGTRWARLVKPAVLQAMMRHSSIETTLSYYVDLDADDIADELWAVHESINTSVNTSPLAGEMEENEAESRKAKSPEKQGL